MLKGLALALAVLAAPLGGCAPACPAAQPGTTARAAASLPDVRVASERPPVVLLAREGDPSGAVAVAVTTRGVDGDGDGDDGAEPAVALAGVVEARLAARGLAPRVVPSWSGLRVALLLGRDEAAKAATDALREALSLPIDDRDLAPARQKLAALAARPLRDAALARWARCVGAPHALPSRAVTRSGELTVAELERWRSRAHGLGRVAFSVVASGAAAEAVASAVARGPAWRTAAPPPARRASAGSGLEVSVYAPPGGPTAPPVVHATLDVATGSEAVSAAEALGDPRGPLAARLLALDPPFRLREVVGTAEPSGGCVGLVLEASPAAASTRELAARVADAVALVHVEAEVHLTEGATVRDGRALARREGDAREAALRAAFWGLADTWSAGGESPRGASATRGSVALGAPLRGASPGVEGALEPSKEALTAALLRAGAAWHTPALELRSRVEAGQGEAWILVASPCGTDGEGELDAGLSALFAVAAAAAAMERASAEVRVEPWIVPDGVGLLVHGAALPGEARTAHARRLADLAARSFASETLAPPALARARAELLQSEARAEVAALGVLAAAVSPGHPASVVARGREDTLARAADAAIMARAEALRSGPLRVAMLANVDAAQGDAALRAVDRWIERRAPGARACRPPSATAAPRAGTYALEARPGAVPEAYLAFPFAPGDARARAAAATVAAALDGEGGLLERALGAGGLSLSSSARIVGWPRAPALAVRVLGPQATLDAAVMQARALLDRLHQGGLGASDLERALVALDREAAAASLDPRARLIATWRDEPVPSPAQPAPSARATAEEVRAFASRALGEDAMVIVAARPARVRAAP